MNKKKLLMAGGGYADIPLIKAAQLLGFYVITSGNRPDEMGHAFSDEYQSGDFSNNEEMLAIAVKNKIDAICPCCNDFSALSSAYVAEKLNLPGHDSYEIAKLLHHKDSYREFAMKNSIPTPKAKAFEDKDSALSGIKELDLPLIVKPVDLTGGKGISIVSSLDMLPAAFDKAFAISRIGKVVIEEFIQGSNHGFSTFIRGGKVVFHFSDNEHYYQNNYLVSGASTPGAIPEETICSLIRETEKIASLLSLQDGIFHVQFILKDKRPYIIEICRRPPGDLYIDFVRHATGIDYPAYIIKAFSNMNLDDMQQVFPNKYCTRHCVMTDKNGMVKDIVFDKLIEDNIIEKFMWWEKGDIVDDFMVQKFGIVFLKYDSLEEMNEKTKKINELIKVELI